MKEEIFRQKSLQRLKSPENLDDYIKVANPGVWLLLASVIILLTGACVWGFYGRINCIAKARVHAEKGVVVCYVSDDDIAFIKKGMTVSFDDYKADITAIGQKENQGYACILQTRQVVPDGFYDGTIVISSIKPISFILN